MGLAEGGEFVRRMIQQQAMEAALGTAEHEEQTRLTPKSVSCK
jgi:hypothetical protein